MKKISEKRKICLKVSLTFLSFQIAEMLEEEAGTKGQEKHCSLRRMSQSPRLGAITEDSMLSSENPGHLFGIFLHWCCCVASRQHSSVTDISGTTLAAGEVVSVPPTVKDEGKRFPLLLIRKQLLRQSAVPYCLPNLCSVL